MAEVRTKPDKANSLTRMKRHHKRQAAMCFRKPVTAGTIIFLVLSLGLVFVSGCTKSASNHPAAFLVKVRNRILTVDDFRKNLELAKISYSPEDLKDPTEERTLYMRLLNQMTEEMILLEKAEDLKIDVSEAELDQKVNEIKKDYPDNTFEETLLENAVSYPDWRKSLKTRLVMEKVIAKELESKITVTDKEVNDFYENRYKNSDLSTILNLSDEAEIEAVIRKSIRKKKAEAAYADWIKTIQNEFVVNINKNEWKKLVGS